MLLWGDMTGLFDASQKIQQVTAYGRAVSSVKEGKFFYFILLGQTATTMQDRKEGHIWIVCHSLPLVDVVKTKAKKKKEKKKKKTLCYSVILC